MSPYDDERLRRLEPFPGTWSIEAVVPGPCTDASGQATFEWLPGERIA